MEPPKEIDKQELIALYKKFHQIPQIGLQQVKTTELILQQVSKLQGVQVIKPQKQTQLKTGAILLIKANENKDEKKNGFLFRCDIDALNFKEESGLEYSSQNGLHHACGHDAHTSILIMALKKIALRRKQLKRDIYFCFQPGEQGHGGALKLLEKFPNLLKNIQKCFALHVGNNLPNGSLIIPQDYASANSNKFNIQIIGKSSHCMIPHAAIDANYIGCQIVNEIYSLKSRLINPFNTLTIAVTRIQGGNQNIASISDKMVITCSIRTFSSEQSQKIIQHVKEYSQALCKVNGAKCTITGQDKSYYRAVKNDPSAIQAVLNAAQGIFSRMEYSKPSLSGEDFCEFSQKKSSCYFVLGVALPGSIDQKSKQSIFPIHSNKFKLNQNSLVNGAKLWEKIAFVDLESQ